MLYHYPLPLSGPLSNGLKPFISPSGGPLSDRPPTGGSLSSKGPSLFSLLLFSGSQPGIYSQIIGCCKAAK